MLSRQLRVTLEQLLNEDADPIVAAGKSPLDRAAGALAGAPVVWPRTAAPSDTRWAPDTVICVVGRPEQWLRGCVGRILGWDAAAGRYHALVKHRRPEGSLLPIQLRPEHVELKTQRRTRGRSASPDANRQLRHAGHVVIATTALPRPPAA